MTTVRAFAPAKINLTLHVTSRRADGYHELDSLVVFAHDVGDWIEVQPAPDLSLSLTGPMTAGVPQGEENLVLKAARLLKSLRDVDAGASIQLEKLLPNGAGIGGGSADAAAAVKALAEMWGVPPLAAEEALPLGADLPVCLAGPASQRMSGIGETLAATPPLPELWLTLVNPGDQIPTAEVFGRMGVSADSFGAAMSPMSMGGEADEFLNWLGQQRNDLAKPTGELSDAIRVALTSLKQAGAPVSGMSGSGSTCWGAHKSRQDAQLVAEKLADQFPGWWIRTTRVR